MELINILKWNLCLCAALWILVFCLGPSSASSTSTESPSTSTETSTTDGTIESTTDSTTESTTENTTESSAGTTESTTTETSTALSSSTDTTETSSASSTTETSTSDSATETSTESSTTETSTASSTTETSSASSTTETSTLDDATETSTESSTTETSTPSSTTETSTESSTTETSTLSSTTETSTLSSTTETSSATSTTETSSASSTTETSTASSTTETSTASSTTETSTASSTTETSTSSSTTETSTLDDATETSTESSTTETSTPSSTTETSTPSSTTETSTISSTTEPSTLSSTTETSTASSTTETSTASSTTETSTLDDATETSTESSTTETSTPSSTTETSSASSTTETSTISSTTEPSTLSSTTETSTASSTTEASTLSSTTETSSLSSTTEASTASSTTETSTLSSTTETSTLSSTTETSTASSTTETSTLSSTTGSSTVDATTETSTPSSTAETSSASSTTETSTLDDATETSTESSTTEPSTLSTTTETSTASSSTTETSTPSSTTESSTADTSTASSTTVTSTPSSTTETSTESSTTETSTLSSTTETSTVDEATEPSTASSTTETSTLSSTTMTSTESSTTETSTPSSTTETSTFSSTTDTSTPSTTTETSTESTTTETSTASTTTETSTAPTTTETSTESTTTETSTESTTTETSTAPTTTETSTAPTTTETSTESTTTETTTASTTTETSTPSTTTETSTASTTTETSTESTTTETPTESTTTETPTESTTTETSTAPTTTETSTESTTTETTTASTTTETSTPSTTTETSTASTTTETSTESTTTETPTESTTTETSTAPTTTETSTESTTTETSTASTSTETSTAPTTTETTTASTTTETSTALTTTDTPTASTITETSTASTTTETSTAPTTTETTAETSASSTTTETSKAPTTTETTTETSTASTTTETTTASTTTETTTAPTTTETTTAPTTTETTTAPTTTETSTAPTTTETTTASTTTETSTTPTTTETTTASTTTETTTASTTTETSTPSTTTETTTASTTTETSTAPTTTETTTAPTTTETSTAATTTETTTAPTTTETTTASTTTETPTASTTTETTTASTTTETSTAPTTTETTTASTTTETSTAPTTTETSTASTTTETSTTPTTTETTTAPTTTETTTASTTTETTTASTTTETPTASTTTETTTPSTTTETTTAPTTTETTTASTTTETTTASTTTETPTASTTTETTTPSTTTETTTAPTTTETTTASTTTETTTASTTTETPTASTTTETTTASTTTETTTASTTTETTTASTTTETTTPSTTTETTTPSTTTETTTASTTTETSTAPTTTETTTSSTTTETTTASTTTETSTAPTTTETTTASTTTETTTASTTTETSTTPTTTETSTAPTTTETTTASTTTETSTAPTTTETSTAPTTTETSTAPTTTETSTAPTTTETSTATETPSTGPVCFDVQNYMNVALANCQSEIFAATLASDVCNDGIPPLRTCIVNAVNSGGHSCTEEDFNTAVSQNRETFIDPLIAEGIDLSNCADFIAATTTESTTIPPTTSTVCTYPTEWQTNTVVDSVEGTVNFTSTTLSGWSEIVHGTTLSEWDCYQKIGNVFILRGESLVYDAGDDAYAYMCMQVDKVNDNLYNYKLLSSKDSNSFQSRLVVIHTSTTPNFLADCNEENHNETRTLTVGEATSSTTTESTTPSASTSTSSTSTATTTGSTESTTTTVTSTSTESTSIETTESTTTAVPTTTTSSTTTDVDECLTNADNCSSDADCTNTPDGFTCTCKTGYDGDGYTCTDINECSTNADNCSSDADCNNTPGGFTCACKTGYNGDGYTCTDINECLTNTDNCSTDADCTNIPGGFTCLCYAGYNGDGYTCTDINECSTNTDNCSSDADCNNTPGGFNCECKTGYIGDGYTCTDVNECTENTHNCSSNADCNNTPGGFTCTCKTGYDGDGYTCIDINECDSTNANNCNNDADCNNTPGGFTCTCKTGYNGDGITCTDVNECSSMANNCSSNADCNNTPGGFTCTCKTGYDGDGYTCTDINECTENTHNCSSDADCNNTPGGFTCTCRSGYTGDGYTCAGCAAGTSFDSTSGTCLSCSLNFFQDNTGSSSCVSCPTNKFTLDTGSTSITDCIDICERDSPCQNGGTCEVVSQTAYTCTCTAIYTGTNCESGDYPYGNQENDNSISWYWYYSIFWNKRKITVDTCFPAGYRQFDTIYIHYQWLTFGPTRWRGIPNKPVEIYRFKPTVYFLAPFWTDMIRGTTFYQVYNLNDQYLSSSAYNRRAFVLDKITTEVRTYYGDYSFQAVWALVVTWDKVEPRYRRAIDESMTFQVVLATDGSKSYIVHNYIRLGWSIYNYKREVAITYRVPGRQFELARGTFSRNRAAFRLDQYQGNQRNRKGYYLWKFSSGYTGVCHRQTCLSWYRNYRFHWNTRLLQTVAYWQMHTCPCFEFFAFIDRRLNYAYRHSWNTRCYTMTSWWFWPSAMTCCYRNFFRISSTTYQSGGMVRFTPWYWGLYQYYDASPKRSCCLYSDLCYLYRQLRPIGFCYFRPPFRTGWTWGDPHIETLDKKKYTFNGHGEYVMLRLKTDNSTFEFQSRMEPVTNINGTTTNATIFSAFAGKDSIGASFQVELSNDKTKLVVYGNGEDFSRRFNDNPSFSHTSSKLDLKRENDTAVVVFASSGLILRITLGIRSLTLATTIPEEFQNLTTGLLGNFDGDPDNDFVLPNGTLLEANDTDTEREIYYDYGQKWAINESESLFKYPQGKSFADYNHPEFEPFFIDEYPQEERDKAKEVCGGENAPQACIFDYLATGDSTVAQSASAVDQEAVKEAEETSNEAPQITGDTEIHATVNEPVMINVNASDDKGYTYQVVSGPAFNFDFNTSVGVITWTPNDTTPVDIRYVLYSNIELSQGGRQDPSWISCNTSVGVITWTLNDTTPVDISITAKDDQDVSADPLEVTVIMCSNCNDHGSCNFTETRASNSTQFKYAVCNCDTGWTGDDCEEDEDGCEASPCTDGRNCTDLTPDEEVRLGRAYNCTPCPTGFQEVEQRCDDIDECNSTAVNPCAQVCDNNEGSYECSCWEGYRMIGQDCRDIDECNENTDGCEQGCTNTEGNFTCSCIYGYERLPDGKSCNQTITDICKLNNLTCEYGCDNNTETGIYECICQSGYELASDNSSCQDINECDNAVCTQECTNKNGSFICSCYTGYQLDTDKISCTACEPPSWGFQCNNTCECGRGMDRCDARRGCICTEGYSGDTCDDDINECIVTPDICPSIQSCVNNIGSYECICPSGYTISGDICNNINECDDNDPVHNCTESESTCQDTEGSFTCVCKEGYIQAGPYNCTDINECDLGKCEQLCDNVAGSYNCDCRFGFELNDDRTTCQKVSDPCSLAGSLNCSYGCILEESTTTCFCASGFKLGTDLQSCLDIQECTDGLHNCSQECVNTEGSYDCSCADGYKLENDGRTCTECDEFHWGPNCVNECGCNPLGLDRCDSISGCICKSGWVGATCFSNVNECLRNPCTGSNQKCVDTAGSYLCQCNDGYENGTSGCQNINECQQTTICDQLCEDTEGNYVCSCRDGFTLDNDGICQDVNECNTGQSQCNQECVNTVGSYLCSCIFGFLLGADRHTCTAKTECTELNCTHTCALRRDRSEYCFCDPGYELHTDNVTCNNINECTVSEPCSQTCTDETPGFKCSCNLGYKLDQDSVTCIECAEDTYGNCSQSCTCVTANRASCNKVTGECVCNDGWNGTNCEIDIDECQANTYTCPTNSECQNTDGSYICACVTGYVSAGGQCIECDNFHWGDDCAMECECNLLAGKGQSCNNTNGICSCKPGWEGTNCSANTNECLNTTVCPVNTECEDTLGSFRCNCKTGFTKNADQVCQDINECLYASDNCSMFAQCTNNEGGFTCACKTGYIGDGYNCTECDATHYGDDCLQNCSCNVANTEKCDNVDGSCTCNTGWEGIICEDNIDECNRTTFDCEPHSQCEDTQGSYICACDAGYAKNDTGYCTACNATHFGQDCATPCSCNFTNTRSCDNVNGTCYCSAGWEGITCDTNINECNVSSPCGPNSDCEDNEGSYGCVCHNLYVKDPSGENCVPIGNECLSGANNCSDYAQCDDTDDGFNCTCNIGYYGDGVNCTECDSTHYGDNCESSCICNVTNTERCDSINGTCYCNEGWRGLDCNTNINECTESLDNCTGQNEECQDTDGSFICKCVLGFSRNSSQQCVDCNSTHYGENCESPCSCNVTNTEDCDNFNGTCYCNKGWTGGTCNDNIDECTDTPNICPGQNVDCDDTDGSYECNCHTGYSKNATEYCVECSSTHYGNDCASPCTCDFTNTESCDNVNGTCYCKNGWRDANCSTNINECTESLHDCTGQNEKCQDTDGSFICKCITGYSRNETGLCVECNSTHYGNDCASPCTCNFTNTESCDSVNGTCYCNPGWRGTDCDANINECTESSHNCTGQNEECEDTDGSFVCKCVSGYSRNDTGLCVECNSTHYGNNCASPCTCNFTNTESCDNVNGTCYCKAGWSGTDCDTNINECTESSHDCTGQNEECEDTEGSFICNCVSGYSRNETGLCVECNSTHYGNDCASPCTCNFTNTESCDNANGTCYCNSGWRGTDCDANINECTESSHNCTGQNEECEDTEGSFICNCVSGYSRNDTGLCIEITTTAATTESTSTTQATTESTSTEAPTESTSTEGPTESTSTEGPTESTSTEGPTESTSTQAPTESTSTEGPTESTSTQAPTESTSTQGPTESTSTEGPTESTSTEGPTESTSTQAPTESTSTQAPTESTSTEAPTESTSTQAPTESTSTQGPTESTSTQAPTESTSTQGSTESTSTEGPTESTSTEGPTESTSTQTTTETTCGPTFYGDNCATPCTCNFNNTETCDNVNGTCYCSSGWRGTNCTDNINECAESSHNCGQNSQCADTDGSFVCNCVTGYIKNNADQCVACESTVYGVNCATPCTCNFTNTDSCDNVNGTCYCSSGWRGTNCNENINECAESSHNCGQNSQCADTDGSFVCNCVTGYIKNNADQCININECVDTPTICGSNADCGDTEGSYTCTCHRGYGKNSAGNCVDFYTYGTSVGDSTLTGDDVTSESITVTWTIPTASKTFSSVTVGSNGVIGLDTDFNSPTPRSFALINADIIAPFWADIDADKNSNGKVFYQAYDIEDTSTNVQLTLSRASKDVQDFAKEADFSARWVLVVTWDRVGPFPYIQNSVPSEETTFQCVLITDGVNSFVIFNYDTSTWLTTKDRMAVIGYRLTAANQEVNTYSGLPAAFRISNILGNQGKAGHWFYRLTPPSTTTVNYRAMCYDWYTNNLPMKATFQAFSDSAIFECPCNFRDLRFDRRWVYTGTPWCRTLLRPRRFPYSKECCYDPRTRSLIRTIPDSGSFLRYNPWRESANSRREDRLPKEHCCERSNMCDKYYEVRPMGRTCYRISFVIIGIFWGDPHIDTLDGKQYTFNGYGEYVLLKVLDQFELQARTSLATSTKNTTINATVFTAFAAKDDGGTHFQVELSPDKTKMVIYGNGNEYTLGFYGSTDFSTVNGDLSLTRDNLTLVALFSSTGISVSVSLGIGMLTVSTSVPKMFSGNTTGLLGNFDGDLNNDFVLPNGTELQANDTDTERKLYENFGQKWAVTAETTAFTYPPGKTALDFSHPDFVPIFIDEYNQTDVDQARTTCGGATASQACIFDFLATGNELIGLDSGNVDAEADQERQDIQNQPPEITGNTTIHVTVNQPFTTVFNATDDQPAGISVVAVSMPTTGFTLDSTTGEMEWTPQDTTPVNISVTALDAKNLSAPTLNIEIILCSGCTNQGSCDFMQTRTAGTSLFKLAVCNCQTGWTGDNCELDYDACTVNPCSQGRNCTDLTPVQQQSQNISFTCGPCPSGYTVQDEKCADVDECSTNMDNCDQECDNTEGSYVCRCRDGYRRVGSVCQDINECTEGTSGCEQSCTNSDGSFTCSCAFGYLLNSDNKTCELETDFCASLNLTCQYACDNSTTGQFRCICENGYELASDGQSCNDIDECSLRICAQGCDNINGSFTCSCNDGFRLDDDKITCNECELPNWGPNCANICNCGAGASSCDSVRGCICKSGWTGSTCSVDINECVETPTICGSDKTCQNVDGSYVCNCFQGYQKVGDNCQDINECSSVELNNCSLPESTCENNDGGYTCRCSAGYQQNGSICSDVNECTVGSHSCSQLCINSIGSYRCDCYDGFTLNSNDRRTCGQVSDPCEGRKNCSYACRVESGNDICYCQSGYELGTDGETCVDVDECSNTTLNLCSKRDSCVNTNGSYSCSCDVGHQLENDGRTCTVCDSEHWGVNCATLCNCGQGVDKCDPTSGCICERGWDGINDCATDKNECTLFPTLCTDSVNEECVNTIGSYRCNCISGYQRNASGVCQNVDECTMNTDGCEQLCTDTEGSYTCSCRPGFSANGTTCTDINECTIGTHQCDQKCINLISTYKCECNHGYLQNTTNVFLCYDINECTENTDNCSSNADCNNTPGGFTCTCRTGFNGDGVNCYNVITTAGPVSGRVKYRSVFTWSGSSTIDTDKYSTSYQTFYNLADSALRDFYTNVANIPSSEFYGVEVYNIRSGSLILDHAVISTEASHQRIFTTLVSLLQGNVSFTFNGTVVPVQSINYTAPDGTLYSFTNTTTIDVCSLFELLRPCEQGYQCTIINNQPKCTVIPKSDNFDLIVGLGVGIPLFVILAVVLITVMCVILRKPKLKHDDSRTVSDEDSIFAPGMARFSSWNTKPYGLYPGDPWETGADNHSFSDREYHDRFYRGEVESRTDGLAEYDNRHPSNFSWDFIHHYVGTDEYKIKRPEVSSKPYYPSNN